MPRIKRGVTSHARHKKLRAQTKGFVGLRHKSVKKAREALLKSWSYAYRDRRTKKRDFRGLWIQRINAAARQHDLTYSQLMHGLNLAGVELNRKMLADIAFNDAETFGAIVAQAKAAIAKGSTKSDKAEKRPVEA